MINCDPPEPHILKEASSDMLLEPPIFMSILRMKVAVSYTHLTLPTN